MGISRWITIICTVGCFLIFITKCFTDIGDASLALTATCGWAGWAIEEFKND